MNARNNAAIEAVKAAAWPEEQPADLHGMFLQAKTAGYVHTLELSACDVQDIASRLRGVEAITGLMLATSNTDKFKTSEYLQSGLLEALHCLASDAHSVLERRNERAAEGAAA